MGDWWAATCRHITQAQQKHRIGEKRDAVFRGIAGLRCQPSLAKASTTSGGA